MIPRSKTGDCSTCDNKNVPVVKVGKNLFCLYNCHRKNKAKAQMQKASLKNKVRSLMGSEVNTHLIDKSQTLSIADRIFGDWIKCRDTVKVIDENTGEAVDGIICPCCKRAFSFDSKDADGKKIIQLLHFVSRGVYSLRFDEDNCFAGDSYCNLQMHLKPTGREYINYRNFLVRKFGEPAVAEMELKKRDINRIEISQLHNIIDHYKN